jgi:TetR/AcrR family transcriptional regulator
MATASGKERILRVAEDLFVEKGFVGTSMSEIAERAGVAKSLIYHHFESKQALWRELIRDYHDKSGVLEKFYDTISADDPDTLTQLVIGHNGFFEFLRSHPRVVRLFSWLDLEQEFDIDYPEESLRLKSLQRIGELQKHGWLRPDIEPGLIPIIFLSLMMHWFSARRYLAPWLGKDLLEEDIDDIYIAGVVDILMKGITRGADG